IAIRRGMGKPVLFSQLRSGQNGRPFVLHKFRTMRNPEGSEGNAADDAQRLTPLGAWLRRYSLDELPQFWNVLRGDMSLVGPRPLLTRYLERYSAEQRRRLESRPGLTGWAQINGRNALTWEEKFACDVWYVEHQSWGLDLQILVRTLLGIFGGKGVSAQNHATMPEFMGSLPNPSPLPRSLRDEAESGTHPVTETAPATRRMECSSPLPPGPRAESY
ncbi:MAG TPA: sugar transferase, partial [Pirellulaceae bacterium]